MAGRGDEAERQHRQQLRLVDDSAGGEELVHRDPDPPLAAEQCQRLVDETPRPPREATRR